MVSVRSEDCILAVGISRKMRNRGELEVKKYVASFCAESRYRVGR
jgi:hypothetical protein